MRLRHRLGGRPQLYRRRPLTHGATSTMNQGKPVGTPMRRFWRVIKRNKAVAFSTAPTAFRAIRKEKNSGRKSLSG